MPAPLRGTARALVVTVSNYAEVSPLPASVRNDGDDLSDLLCSPSHCGYDRGDVRELHDDQATLANLRSELALLESASRDQDTVVIYFSGHGVRLGSGAFEYSGLVPYDCQLKAIETTCLPEQELSEVVRRIRAKRLLILLDACHSAGAAVLKGGEGDPSARSFSFSEKSLARLAAGSGRVLIASSRSTETSLVLPGARNSVFTQHLLEALRGQGYSQGDGLIRVFDIFNYVSESVHKTVPDQQHPVFKANDVEDNFAVALDKGGKVKQVMADSGNVPSQATEEFWKLLHQVLSSLYPHGPNEENIWSRAGGDISTLRFDGSGRSNWFAALRTLRLGGGGNMISTDSLVETGLDDYPHHPRLLALRRK